MLAMSVPHEVTAAQEEPSHESKVLLSLSTMYVPAVKDAPSLMRVHPPSQRKILLCVVAPGFVKAQTVPPRSMAICLAPPQPIHSQQDPLNLRILRWLS